MAAEPDPELLQELAEGPVAMMDRDLRSMKDKLLIETAEMLGVSLLAASTLLKEYGKGWLGFRVGLTWRGKVRGGVTPHY